MAVSREAKTAAVLAGGQGTRLRAALKHKPKALAPVAGRAFALHLLDQLADAGVERVVFCTGHLAEQLPRALGRRYRGMTLCYSRERRPLGTAGALGLARPLLRGADPILVLNGDSYCDAPIEAFWEWHTRRGAEASMVLSLVSKAARFGSVRCDGERIVGFQEKARAGRGWVNAGVYLFSKAVIDRLPADRPCSLEEEVLPELVDGRLHGYRSRGRFLDIGTPASYLLAEKFFKQLPPGAGRRSLRSSKRSGNFAR